MCLRMPASLKDTAMLPTFDLLRTGFVTVDVATAAHASPTLLAQWQAQRLSALLKAARRSAIYAPWLEGRDPGDTPLSALPVISR